MRNKILVSLLVGLMVIGAAFSIACSSEEAATPGMEHYSDHGISFDYPDEWYEVGFEWAPGYEWGTCFSGGVGDEPGVFVLRYYLGDSTLGQFAEETRDIGYGTDFTISTPAEVIIDGKPAYRYNYSGNKYGTEVKGDTLIIQTEDSVWWIDFFATEAEYPENQANFEKIVDSLVVT